MSATQRTSEDSTQEAIVAYTVRIVIFGILLVLLIKHLIGYAIVQSLTSAAEGEDYACHNENI